MFRGVKNKKNETFTDLGSILLSCNHCVISDTWIENIKGIKLLILKNKVKLEFSKQISGLHLDHELKSFLQWNQCSRCQWKLFCQQDFLLIKCKQCISPKGIQT